MEMKMQMMIAEMIASSKRKSAGLEAPFIPITGLPSCDRILGQTLAGDFYAIMGDGVYPQLFAWQCMRQISRRLFAQLIVVDAMMSQERLEARTRALKQSALREKILVFVVGTPAQEYVLELYPDVLFHLIPETHHENGWLLKMLKNRHGPTKDSSVFFDPQYQQFLEDRA